MLDRALQRCIIAVSLIFLASSIVGYLTPVQVKEEIARELSRVVTPIKGFSPPVLLMFVFLNNALKALLAVLLGFLFGIVPLIFTAGNGYLLGLLVSLSQARMGLKDILLRVLPHGIIEIPAFLVAGGLGLWLGVQFFEKLRRGSEFRPCLVTALKWFIKVLAPLFLLAAMIEIFVTPYLAGIKP